MLYNNVLSINRYVGGAISTNKIGPTSLTYGLAHYLLLFNDRHWPIGLIYNNHTISSMIHTNLQASTSQCTPLKLILHLTSPPTNKLLLSPSTESYKQAFMGQLKEANFMRWRNTKRMTRLRKAEQDRM